MIQLSWLTIHAEWAFWWSSSLLVTHETTSVSLAHEDWLEWSHLLGLSIVPCMRWTDHCPYLSRKSDAAVLSFRMTLDFTGMLGIMLSHQVALLTKQIQMEAKGHYTWTSWFLQSKAFVWELYVMVNQLISNSLFVKSTHFSKYSQIQ